VRPSMLDVDRFKLLRGPYRAPRCRVGGYLKCVLRGQVRVAAISSGRIPWPMTRQLPTGGGRAVHIVTREMLRAINVESNQAVAHWWGVSAATVSNWRRALNVPRANAGTHRLAREHFAEICTPAMREKLRASTQRPERNAKMSAAKRGRPVPPHVTAMLRRLRLGVPNSPEARRKMSASQLRRWAHWTPETEALLGTMPDREVAARLGCGCRAVWARRARLGVSAYRGPRR
jgi:hypothetical protein